MPWITTSARGGSTLSPSSSIATVTLSVPRGSLVSLTHSRTHPRAASTAGRSEHTPAPMATSPIRDAHSASVCPVRNARNPLSKWAGAADLLRREFVLDKEDRRGGDRGRSGASFALPSRFDGRGGRTSPRVRRVGARLAAGSSSPAAAPAAPGSSPDRGSAPCRASACEGGTGSSSRPSGGLGFQVC